MLLEETSNLDVIEEVTEGGDTPIHLACRHSQDIQFLESLLIKIRSQLGGDKEKI